MAEARKTVTVVFTDVSGSTELGERLDPEVLRRVLERYFAEARGALERHGGTVEKFIGDAVMAAFGIPAAHEDDALRAVRAATELRARLVELSQELERERGVALPVRIGVNTGEVVVGDPASGQFYATGDAVNVAARLEQAAEPGEILLGERTFRLVRDAIRADALEPLRLKGKAAAVAAFRLVDVDEGAPAVARRFDTPFVGRREELRRLLGCFEHSLAERVPVLVTVVGSAGIGKTRLAAELIAGVGERGRVLEGRCLSYGEGITFWPLQEILRGLPERPPDAPDPEQVKNTEETFWAYRKLFEALAGERPLMLILEDIHWAEPTLLDLVEHMVEWTHDAPMTILCLARPELLDERPGWPGERVELEPLPDEEAEALVEELAVVLDVDVRSRVVSVAEGNPLFLEQMLALAAEGEGGEVAVPQTIQALLTARLDRLEAEERDLLAAAAVVGKEFWRGALQRLSRPETRVSVLLQRLVRRRLIRPERSSLRGEDAFRFGHILIRDAAYNSIPKETRADLHERFADWLDESGSSYEEIVGYHLEQAYGYREELGAVDESGQRLAQRAARFLLTAGRRAGDRLDHVAAVNLLGRAVDLLPDDDEELRLSLLPDLGESLFWDGRYAEARSVLDEAVEGARRAGSRGVEWQASLARLRLEAQVGPTASSMTSREMVDKGREALAAFEELDDPRGQAKAGCFIGEALTWLFRNEEAARAFRQARAQARLAGDESLEAICDGELANALADGPTPIDEAVKTLEELISSAGGVLSYERWLLTDLAHLYAKQGRFEEARASIARARALAEELGNKLQLATLRAFHAASIERHAGNLEGAEADLRYGYEVLERFGETGWRSTVAAHLADVLVARGRREEAERFLRISEETAASDDIASQVPLRWIRARIHLERGEAEEAERLVHEALSLLEGTDDLDMRTKALIDLAAVLRSAGKASEAIPAADEALRLAKQRGNALLERDARNLLHELSNLSELPS